ncbi:MAG: hypothetical protein FWF03_08720, partial [Defluviitaleaceae bacterium]|nr:hypothetical protein [Defluviitaleaceae bacterium]
QWFAKQACEAGAGAVIGVGGDGTLQEIVTGMRLAYPDGRIRAKLGVFPYGSGNDFALTYGGGVKFKKANRIEAGIENIIADRTREIDLIDVNCGEMTCLNIANVGLDARIVENAAALKQKFGSRAYLAAAYKSISRHENVEMEIIADGETLEGPFTLAAACNGRYYGGGLRISPGADLSDGLITLCTVSGMSRRKAMLLFPSVLFGLHGKLKEVKYFPCEKVSFNVKGGETLCVDGNLYKRGGALSFSILPGALRAFTP